MHDNLLKLLESGEIGANAILGKLDNVESIRQLTEFVYESLAEAGIDHAAPILPATLEEARKAAAEYISSCRTSYLDVQMPAETGSVFSRLEAWDIEKKELKGYRIASIAKLLFPGFETIEPKDIRGKLFTTLSGMDFLYFGWRNKKGHHCIERQRVINYLGGLVLSPEMDVLIKGDNDESLKVRDIMKLKGYRRNLVFHRKYVPLLIERDLGIKPAPPQLPEEYVPLNAFVKCEIFEGAGILSNSATTRRAYYKCCAAILERLKQDGKDIRIGKCPVKGKMNFSGSDQEGIDLFFNKDLLPEVRKVTAWMKPSNYNIITDRDICQNLKVEASIANLYAVRRILAAKTEVDITKTIEVRDKKGRINKFPMAMTGLLADSMQISDIVRIINPGENLEALITKKEIVAEAERIAAEPRVPRVKRNRPPAYTPPGR